MANHTFIDAGSVTRYRKATGAGTDVDPAVLHNIIDSGVITAVTTVSTVTSLSQFGGQAITLGAGAVAAGTLRITMASDSPDVALLTTIDADTGGILTAIQIIDDWDESDRCKVNLIVGQAGIAAGAGAVGATVPRVTLASDDPGVALLTTIDADTGGILTAIQIIDDWDESDRAKVNPIVGQAGVAAGAGGVGATVPRVVLCNDSPNLTHPMPSTSGGLTIFKSIDLDESEEEVKASAGQVYFIHCMNLTAAKLYLKLYNDTAANVIVGTTVPVATFPLPTTGDTNGAGFVVNIDKGLAFSAAICAAVTTGLADADTGAPAANAAVITIGYK